MIQSPRDKKTETLYDKLKNNDDWMENETNETDRIQKQERQESAGKKIKGNSQISKTETLLPNLWKQILMQKYFSHWISFSFNKKFFVYHSIFYKEYSISIYV